MQGGQSPYLFTNKDTLKDTIVGQGFIYRGLCYKMGDLHNNTPLKKEWTEPINFSSWDWCKQTQTPKNSWLNTGRVTSLELLRRNWYTIRVPFWTAGHPLKEYLGTKHDMPPAQLDFALVPGFQNFSKTPVRKEEKQSFCLLSADSTPRKCTTQIPKPTAEGAKEKYLGT